MPTPTDQLKSPLQTRTWADVCASRGKSTLTGAGPGWHALAIVEDRTFGRYVYVPYGPVADDPEALAAGLRWARDVARERNAVFLRVEPPAPTGWGQHTLTADTAAQRALLAQWDFQPAPSDIQPRRTRCIDLTRDTAEILADMTGTNRTVYRSADQRGLSIEASHDPGDLVHLTPLIDGTSARRDFTAHAHDDLYALAEAAMPAQSATLFLTRHQDRVVSALLTVDGGGIRIFAHGASDRRFSKLRAHQSAVVTAILQAKEIGLRVADLYGIAPTDDPDHPWAGFTKFKASFGGHVVEHAGAWDLPIAALSYKALKFGRDVLPLLRRSAG